jgi:hypothetical protein
MSRAFSCRYLGTYVPRYEENGRCRNFNDLLSHVYRYVLQKRIGLPILKSDLISNFRGKKIVLALKVSQTQGDQMSLWKNHPSCNPFFCQNMYMLTPIHKKYSSPNMSDTSLILKELPKVNNRPLGENSPNLVTLTQTDRDPRRCWIWKFNYRFEVKLSTKTMQSYEKNIQAQKSSGP